MLGSVADAEDAVQEAFIRWIKAERGDVREPEAFLRRTVTRLCLDQLKSARHQRETYLGPWLPDPVVEEAEEADDVTLPLMLAAFLLHDVFDFGYGELATILRRSEAACRQLTARAREYVRAAQPRFELPADGGARILQAFLEAAQSGDARHLAALLTDNVALHTDGGGRRRAALRVILGRDRVARGITGIMRKFAQPVVAQCPARIGGLPGIITRYADGGLQTTALQLTEGRISAIYVVTNPEKLQHLVQAQILPE
jgi:RNA polymerase sigma-70 factor (ECF subfamily)